MADDSLPDSACRDASRCPCGSDSRPAESGPSCLSATSPTSTSSTTVPATRQGPEPCTLHALATARPSSLQLATMQRSIATMLWSVELAARTYLTCVGVRTPQTGTTNSAVGTQLAVVPSYQARSECIRPWQLAPADVHSAHGCLAAHVSVALTRACSQTTWGSIPWQSAGHWDGITLREQFATAFQVCTCRSDTYLLQHTKAKIHSFLYSVQ